MEFPKALVLKGTVCIDNLADVKVTPSAGSDVLIKMQDTKL
jgi:hypothetical protein